MVLQLPNMVKIKSTINIKTLDDVKKIDDSYFDCKYFKT